MSAILSADDLNDFISPGVACIKPVETLPHADPPADPPAAEDETEVVLDGGGPGQAAEEAAAAAAAQISLTDCLACSGCVTSAEAVLVSLQSHAEVLATLDAAPALRAAAAPAVAVEGLAHPGARLLVASVSPQAVASLAAAAGPGPARRSCDARRALDVLLCGDAGLASTGRWGSRFSWVIDTDAVRRATLVLAADEALAAASSPSSSRAPALPILAASCPGWVCYTEKTHPHLLPHLSRVKSPQALVGTLLKTTLRRALGISPARIWHLAIMPCFDKKLEASREELTDRAWADSPGPPVRDVDCVITSEELLMLCESRGIDFFQLAQDRSAAPPPQSFPDPRIRELLFPPRRPRCPPRAAGSSGGLLHYILQRRAAQTPGSEIQTTRGRNADLVEYCVSLDGQPLFRAARYYGFRNIQNLVRKLKPARPSRMPGGKPFGSARRTAGKSAPSPEYGYVEVMACPGGCTHGGGQIKVDDPIVVERRGLVGKPGPQEQKDWLAEVDEAYFSDEAEAADDPGGGDVIDGISSSHIHDTLAYWSEMTRVTLDRLALTNYREVVSDVGKGRATDADKVVQLAGKIGGGW